MRIDPFVHDLAQARSLVEVVRVVFETVAIPLGMRSTQLELHDAAGEPVVCVTAAEIRPERTRGYLSAGFRDDPYLRRMREVFAVVATGDPGLGAGIGGEPIVAGPLVGKGQLIGALRVAAPAVAAELRRAVAAVTLHLSVRLAELGFSVDSSAELLTRRQRAVADLAAQGLSTSEIGLELRISPNTVKKHLKLVFSRLGIGSRVELATRTGRADTRIDQLDDLRAHGLRVVWSEDDDEPLNGNGGPGPYTGNGPGGGTRPPRSRVPSR